MASAPPIDQGAIIRSGQASVGNYAEQALQRAMLGIQQQQADTDSGRLEVQRRQEVRLGAAAQAEQARRAGFQQDFQAYLQNPTSSSLGMLFARYPDFHDATRAAFTSRTEAEQRVDRNALGVAFSALRAGNIEVALQGLRRRRDADQAAGQNVDDDSAVIRMIESGNPEQIRAAQGLLAYALAGTLQGDNYSAGLGRLLEQLDPGDDFASYAAAQGLQPGTEQYRAALRDFVLRANGPTAYGYARNLERQRQEGRVELEGERQGGEERIEGMRERGRVNRQDRAEQQRRTRPGGTVLERISQKIANGEALTPGEQRVWDSRPGQSRRPGRNGGGGNGPVIRNPQTGQQMQLRNGQWVAM